MWNNFLEKIQAGDRKYLARCISLIENESSGYDEAMELLPAFNTPVIGITGPPGAGKSTVTDCLIKHLVAAGKKVAVLCIDPSSPFHLGALLGDRIRMSRWYNTPEVFIRSLAGKKSLGGLSPKAVEITELLKAAGFDLVIIETIGVGQNEIEIAALADLTIAVLVPEAGDDIQTMKAGLMEIADIFVLNKCDRSGAATFVNHLKSMLAGTFRNKATEVQIIKMTATKDEGTEELLEAIWTGLSQEQHSEKKYNVMADRVYQLIKKRRMADVSMESVIQQIKLNPEMSFYQLAKLIKS